MQADMTLLFSCSHCPQNKRWGTCVHTLFLRRHAFQYVLFSEQSQYFIISKLATTTDIWC